MVEIGIRIITTLTTVEIFKEVWCGIWCQIIIWLILVLAYGNIYDTWKFSPSIIWLINSIYILSNYDLGYYIYRWIHLNFC